MKVINLSTKIDKQLILKQLDELKSNLMFMKDQLEKEKKELDDPDLTEKLNKSKNFFTEPIINKIEENINNKKLIKNNSDSINVIEDYIKNIENIKVEISDKIKDNKYDSESLKSISSSLNETNSAVSSLCKSESNSTNGLQKVGKTLSYGGKIALGLGAASLFLFPFATLPLLFTGGVVTLAGWVTNEVGKTIESIKDKMSKFFKRNKKS